MTDANVQDQSVVAAPKNQGISLGNAALTRKYAKLANPAALLAVIQSGDKDAIAKYESDMADLYRGIGSEGAKFSAATQVSAAYVVRAMDMAAGSAGTLGSADMDTVRKALSTVDADGEVVLPHKTRISQFRLSAVVIFDRAWPQDAADFGPMLTTRQNARGMSKAIRAEGATVETIRKAWEIFRDAQNATVIEGETSGNGGSEGGESGGTGAQLNEGETSVRQSPKSLLDAIETAISNLPTDMSVEEWVRTHALIERIESVLDSAEAKADGLKALKSGE